MDTHGTHRSLQVYTVHTAITVLTNLIDVSYKYN